MGNCTLSASICRFLDEYAAFHHKTKGKAEARYLVYHCVGANSSDKCGGLGDRVRGMLFLFRVAIATRRILLLKWTHPLPLEMFFKPSLIDWRTEIDQEHKPIVRFEKIMNMPKGSEAVWPNGTLLDLSKQTFESAWHDVKVANVQTNMFADAPLFEAPHLNDKSLHFKHCLFRYLFLFSDLAESEGRKYIRRLYNNAPYPAAHLRLGFSPDENKGRERGVRAEVAVACARTCSARLARCSNVTPNTSVPLLVVTDHTDLRQEILAGKHPVYASLPYTRTFHLDYSPSRNITEHITTMVELYVLAHASSLVVSRSGYSHIALWHNGINCYQDIVQCNCPKQIT